MKQTPGSATNKFLAYPTGISVTPTGARKCRLTQKVAKSFNVNVLDRHGTEQLLSDKVVISE